MAWGTLTIQASYVALEIIFSAKKFQIGKRKYSLAGVALENIVLFANQIRVERRNFGHREINENDKAHYADIKSA